MTEPFNLAEALHEQFGDQLQSITTAADDMVTIEVAADQLLAVCQVLRDDHAFSFDQLSDVCGVDYLEYGISEWRTTDTTASGFSRGQNLNQTERVVPFDKPRFASVYHLLSLKKNIRLRIKVFLDENSIRLPSVCDLWPSANWFEREAFDLYGFEYEGHPDLRRILTDYGFKGHPFRKDFPLIGEVELRYDAAQQRCVYEPVSIQPRINVPKVIREDNRYVETPKAEEQK